MTSLSSIATPHAHFIPGASASAHLTGTSIRALFRDTALQVSMLAQGAEIPSIVVLRRDCKQLIDAFKAALEQRKLPKDVIDDALLAQCGLLDETVLRHLSMTLKSEWDISPLQVEYLKHHDAGEKLYERISARMRETPANVELLECFSTVLGLGFQGRYARDGEHGEKDRSALITALDAQISQLRPMPAQSLIVDHTGGNHFNWLYRLSPWAMVGIAVVATVLLYLVLRQSLDSQVAHLLQQKP